MKANSTPVTVVGYTKVGQFSLPLIISGNCPIFAGAIEPTFFTSIPLSFVRPLLKINRLTHLQDARSCAAVGFDYISFSLERGDPHKLSAAMVWNIVQWLSGPKVVLDLNRQSLEELEAVRPMFSWEAVSLPAADWDRSLELAGPVILRAESNLNQEELAWLKEQAGAAALQFELAVETGAQAQAYAPVVSELWLHFSQTEALEAYVKAGGLPPLGFVFGEELRDPEEPEFLDYTRLDDLLVLLEEAYPDEASYPNPHD